MKALFDLSVVSTNVMSFSLLLVFENQSGGKSIFHRLADTLRYQSVLSHETLYLTSSLRGKLT